MKYFLFLWLTFLTLACAPKVIIQQAYSLDTENETQSNSKNRVDVKTFYGGDAFDFITFQIDIDNRSNDSISLHENDVELVINYLGDKRRVISPIRKNKLITDLEFAEERMDQEKKASTAANGFFLGLGVLAGVLSGANSVENILYTTESAVYLIDERRQYDLAQGSIEDQLAYLEEYTLGSAIVAPGRSASYDVHFDRLMLDTDCELIIYFADTAYSFPYDLVVEEVKLQR